MKIMPKIVLVFLAATLLPALVVGLVTLVSFKSSLTDQNLQQLASVAASRRQTVEALAQQYRQQLDIMARQALLLENLAAFLEKGEESRQQLLNGHLQQLAAGPVAYDEMTILSKTGRAVASTQLQKLGVDYSGQGFLAGGREWALQPFLDQEQLKLYLVVGIDRGEERLGALLAVVSGKELAAVMASRQGLTASGEAMLLGRNDLKQLVFVTPSRSTPDEALRQLAEPEKASAMMEAALAGQKEVFASGRDYLGQPVLAVSEPVAVNGWGIVVKVDQAEAMTAYRSLRGWLLPLLLLLAGGAAGLAWRLSKRISQQLADYGHVVELVGQGTLDQHVKVSGKDEFAELAKTVNSMVNRLRRADWQQSQQVSELDNEMQLRRQQESRLYDNHKLTELAMKMAKIGFWQVDLQGEKLYASPVMRQLINCQDKELSLADLYVKVADEQRSEVEGLFRQALAGDFKPFDFTLTDNGKERKVLTLGVVLLKDKEGKAVRALGVCQGG